MYIYFQVHEIPVRLRVREEEPVDSERVGRRHRRQQARGETRFGAIRRAGCIGYGEYTIGYNGDN